MNRAVSYIGLLFILPITMQAPYRSVHRKPDLSKSELRAKWVDDDTQITTLHTDDLDKQVIFELCDHDHIKKNTLPSGPITFRHHADKTVDGRVLKKLISELIEELKKKKYAKKTFKHFTVLKKNNFNPKQTTGLLIVKFNDYPFVAKLFFETPHAFVRPRLRDLEQRCLFQMGCGISRYLVGFTRIKNLHYIRQKIAQNPLWSQTTDTPRKWFWIPDDTRWFEVAGYNVSGIPEQHIVLPSVYVVIADAIEAERKLSILNRQDRTMVLSLATSLEERLDPYIVNYVIEKDTGLLVFYDTEHFPTNVGLKKRLKYSTYNTWMGKLVGKFFGDVYLRTKKDRLAMRNGTAEPFIQCIDCEKPPAKCCLARG